MLIKFRQRDYKDLKNYCGLRIWNKPEPTTIYSIGADVAEGVGGDASVAQVINCRNGLLVASFWSNIIDTDNYAAELYKLGKYYNNAGICIELNNCGHGVVAHLSGAVGGLAYPNLYKRVVFDEYTQKKTKQIGLRTTGGKNGTRVRIIDNLKAALRDGELVVLDKETIKELGNFIRDDRTGHIGAKGKASDDRVIALALAWEQARQYREINTSQDQETPQFEYDPITGFPTT